MRELGIRLRALVGALPVGVERLAGTAVGGWLPPAVPWLVAAVAAVGTFAFALSLADLARDYPQVGSVAGGLLGGGVGLGIASIARGNRPLGSLAEVSAFLAGLLIGGALATLLSDRIAAAPVAASGVAGLLVGGVVLGRRLRRRPAETAREPMTLVPGVIWALLLLTLAPALQAGAEIIITRATAEQFVERQVVAGATLVEMQGLALLMPFRAEAPLDPESGPVAGTFHWFALRDSASSRQIALVRSPLAPTALQRREVVAEIRDDIDADAALAGLRDRGISVPESVSALVLRGTDASADPGGDIRRLDSLADLDGLPAGSLVRMTLDFPGDAVAACVPAGGGCQARRLARGIGPWLHLARDPASGEAVLVQLAYPPSVAPLQAVGRQDRDPGAVARFLDGPQVRLLLGWAQVQRRAVVDQDPSLPVDRLWIGPIIFLAVACLLWLGRRLGYPAFRATAQPVGRWATALAPRPTTSRASGWLSSPGRSPLELKDTPVRLARVGDETRLTVIDTEPALSVTVPRALGALSVLMAGELRFVSARRAALRVGWYGSQLELVFGSAEERDAAAGMLSGSA